MMTPLQLKHPELCSLQALDDKVASWHERKYGSPAPTNPARTFAKLIEEVGEVAEAWSNYFAGRLNTDQENNLATRKAQVLEELADTIIVCLNLSRAVGGGLPMAILQKLQVIHERLYTDRRIGRNSPAYSPPSPAGSGEALVTRAVAPSRLGGPAVREDALSPSWASPVVAGVSVEEGSP